MIGHRTYRGRCQFGHQGAIQRASLTADSRDASIELSSVFPRRSLNEKIAFDDIAVGIARWSHFAKTKPHEESHGSMILGRHGCVK